MLNDSGAYEIDFDLVLGSIVPLEWICCCFFCYVFHCIVIV